MSAPESAMIIDAHAHICAQVAGQTGSGPTQSLTYGRVRWGDDRVIRLLPPYAGKTRFPPEVLLEYMDWAGVDKTVLLQGPFYGNLNGYIHEALLRWPDRFLGAAYVDLMSERAMEDFQHVVDDLGFRIIKQEISIATGFAGMYPGFRLDDPRHAWFWEEAERRQLVITLDLGAVGAASYQTGAVEGIVERHPDLSLVIAHLAQPPITGAEDTRLLALWQAQVLLARSPRVWLDLSALPAYWGQEDYPYPTARCFIRRAVECVGADKLLWGTDVPGLLSQATYGQLLTYVMRHCEFLSDSERRKILGENAWRVYGRAGIA